MAGLECRDAAVVAAGIGIQRGREAQHGPQPTQPFGHEVRIEDRRQLLRQVQGAFGEPGTFEAAPMARQVAQLGLAAHQAGCDQGQQTRDDRG